MYKILIVDDVFVNILLIKEIIRSIDAEIAVAYNGLAAVNIAKTQDFDLILMDTQIPIMTGIEATQEIRKFSNVPIIAVTVHKSCIAHDHIGLFISYTEKPIAINKFLQLVKDTLEKK